MLPERVQKIMGNGAAGSQQGVNATRPGVYDWRDASTPQRVAMAVAVAASAVMAWWLLFWGGLSILSVWSSHLWTHSPWQVGNPVRRLLLALALSVYFFRLLLTLFVFFKRGIRWNEAAVVAGWVAFIYLAMSVAGGTNGVPVGIAAGAGVVLFLLGSWMNTWAEYARHQWRQRPENRGRLYTAGLFRLCRHPNYLGDLISFSGLAFIVGLWITGIVPVLMLLGFVFANIPMLDAHLAEHYGDDFAVYSGHTRKLIPFLY